MPPRTASARGIGSSQIAALVGLHPYRDVFDVFNEIVLGVQQRRAGHLDWGNSVEGAIVGFRRAQLEAHEWDSADYIEAFGDRWLGRTTVRAAHSSIALASSDALFSLPEQGAQVEEGKAVGYHESWEWGDADDACPVGYRLQNLWQQGCTGIHQGELVASIAGAPPATWPVEWDAGTYENLVVIAERFWFDNVLGKKPPRPVDGSAAATAYVWARYPQETAPLDRATPEIESLVAEWDAARRARKAALEAETTLENRLCERIGDRLGFQLADGRRVTWKAQKTKGGGTTRVLRLPEPKQRS